MPEQVSLPGTAAEVGVSMGGFYAVSQAAASTIAGNGEYKSK